MRKADQARADRDKTILAVLDAPGGRERSDADIAGQVNCTARIVARVRSNHPTPEQMERKMKALDSVFPGIYQWHMDSQARKNERDRRVASTQVADGVNSPNLGQMIGIEQESK